MKCDESLPFWVSWRNDTIEVGKGFPYTQRFVHTHVQFILTML